MEKLIKITDTFYSKENIKKILKNEYSAEYIKLFGIIHFRYQDCKKDNLIFISPQISAHKDCILAFEKMHQDALIDNINLKIISGYRSSNYQITIFKKNFLNKNEPTEIELNLRLKYSAPAGFSEHHTGFAIDINSVENDFAFTKEYEWLKNNANKYGFENSFPINNKQGLGFEPWHWRFINKESKKIFKLARNL